MFCSNCGFENPAMHRFCGMCGTPLPQRPITAPGAQSTLSYTRLPVEGAQPVSSSSAIHSGSVAPAAIEAPRSATIQPGGGEQLLLTGRAGGIVRAVHCRIPLHTSFGRRRSHHDGGQTGARHRDEVRSADASQPLRRADTGGRASRESGGAALAASTSGGASASDGDRNNGTASVRHQGFSRASSGAVTVSGLRRTTERRAAPGSRAGHRGTVVSGVKRHADCAASRSRLRHADGRAIGAHGRPPS